MRRLFNINKQRKIRFEKSKLLVFFMEECIFDKELFSWTFGTQKWGEVLCKQWLLFCKLNNIEARANELKDEIDTTEILWILLAKHGVKGEYSEVFREVVYSRARESKARNIDIADRIFKSGKYELI